MRLREEFGRASDDVARAATHFAALGVLAEAAPGELTAASDAAAAVARSGVGLRRTEASFFEFLARTRQADAAITAALHRQPAAWNAFFDAVLADDDS